MRFCPHCGSGLTAAVRVTDSNGRAINPDGSYMLMYDVPGRPGFATGEGKGQHGMEFPLATDSTKAHWFNGLWLVKNAKRWAGRGYAAFAKDSVMLPITAAAKNIELGSVVQAKMLGDPFIAVVVMLDSIVQDIVGLWVPGFNGPSEYTSAQKRDIKKVISKVEVESAGARPGCVLVPERVQEQLLEKYGKQDIYRGMKPEKPKYRAASSGAGKRNWRVIWEDGKGGHRELRNERGRMTYYGSYDAAQKVADKLNRQKAAPPEPQGVLSR